MLKKIKKLFSKAINRLRIEINRLLSKGMPYIYIKIIIENNWYSQNFDLKLHVAT